MGKRFTDTQKWNKPWFRKLTPVEKAAWFYITENCDNVGVWDGDTELAEFCIGDSVDWKALIDKVNGNIEILPNGKWWLTDYCEFQHTDLDPSSQSKTVRSYLKLLKKHDLYERVMKAFGKPLDTFSKGYKEREKEREGEREREKDTATPKKEYATSVHLTEKEYNTLLKDFGETVTKKALEKLSNYKGANGKKYKSDYLAILNWVIKGVTGSDPGELRDKRKAEQSQPQIIHHIGEGKVYGGL